MSCYQCLDLCVNMFSVNLNNYVRQPDRTGDEDAAKYSGEPEIFPRAGDTLSY